MPKKEELPEPFCFESFKLQALARARQSALHAGRVWRKEWNHPKTQVRPSTTNVGRARASQMKGRQENETALLQNSIELTRAALFPDLGLIVHKTRRASPRRKPILLLVQTSSYMLCE